VAWGQGDLVRAMALHEEALVLARQTGDRAETTYLIVSMGYVAEDAGELEKARERYRAALPTYQELDRKWGIALCLEGLAGVALAGGDAAGAVCVLGTATALREAQALPVPPIYRARRDRLVATCRATLGSVAFSAAWDAGHATALGDAITALLRDPRTPDSPEQMPNVEPVAIYRLTPREHEVLTLLVEGKADREIGDALFIGTRTVQTHVANLFAKLGVNARAEAAAVAVRRGLV
jgi:DNA-binding CsgD family transcriptional regulator